GQQVFVVHVRAHLLHHFPTGSIVALALLGDARCEAATDGHEGDILVPFDGLIFGADALPTLVLPLHVVLRQQKWHVCMRSSDPWLVDVCADALRKRKHEPAIHRLSVRVVRRAAVLLVTLDGRSHALLAESIGLQFEFRLCEHATSGCVLRRELAPSPRSRPRAGTRLGTAAGRSRRTGW